MNDPDPRSPGHRVHGAVTDADTLRRRIRELAPALREYEALVALLAVTPAGADGASPAAGCVARGARRRPA